MVHDEKRKTSVQTKMYMLRSTSIISYVLMWNLLGVIGTLFTALH